MSGRGCWAGAREKSTSSKFQFHLPHNPGHNSLQPSSVRLQQSTSQIWISRNSSGPGSWGGRRWRGWRRRGSAKSEGTDQGAGEMLLVVALTAHQCNALFRSNTVRFPCFIQSLSPAASKTLQSQHSQRNLVKILKQEHLLKQWKHLHIFLFAFYKSMKPETKFKKKGWNMYSHVPRILSKQ